MELPSILFFSISYLISSICCCIGGLALVISTDSDSSDHPLPLPVALVINQCISISVFTSSTYAFLFRPVLENQQPHTSLHHGLVTVGKALISIVCAQIFIILLPSFIPFSWIILSFLIFGYLYYVFAYKRAISPSIRMYLNHIYCWGLLSVVFAELAIPSLFLSILIYLSYLLVPVSFSITYIAFKEQFSRWTASPFVMSVYRKRKILEFAVGMVSTILFQYIFRAASMVTMVAFFCIATAWLGNLAMVQPSTDLGIFNFLLMNACLNWAVNIFKLNGYTWLVFGSCLLLFLLRWKLDSVSLRYNHVSVSLHDHSHSPLPTTVSPSIPTMLIANISALPQSSDANDPIPSATESSLQLTLSNLQPPLLPPTLPTSAPARVHSF